MTNRTRNIRVSVMVSGARQHSIDDLAVLTKGLDPLLYAFRMEGQVIKIGFTTNLDNRRATLGRSWSDLLAIKLGTRQDELALHRSIPDSHRAHAREWYRPTPQIIAMLDEWRSAYNLPPIETAA